MCCGTQALGTSVAAQAVNDPWVRVQVTKKDAQGHFYRVDSSGANLVASFAYVLDTKTGTLYVDDPVSVVAMKCCLIATSGAFLATVLQTSWYLARIVIDTAVIGSSILQELGKHFAKGDYEEGLTDLRAKISSELAPILIRDLWRVVSSPFYGLGIELAAIYGIFCPYEGRALVARIEKEWKGGQSYKESFCLLNSHEDDPKQFCASLDANVRKVEVCYLAVCFQARGDINNAQKFQEVSRGPIQYFPT